MDIPKTIQFIDCFLLFCAFFHFKMQKYANVILLMELWDFISLIYKVSRKNKLLDDIRDFFVYSLKVLLVEITQLKTNPKNH